MAFGLGKNLLAAPGIVQRIGSLSIGMVVRLCAALIVTSFLISCDGPEQREAAHFERGKAYFASGDFIKARLEFQNVLQINPRNVEGRYFLAVIHEAQGDVQQAFANFQQAVEQQPDHLPSLVKVGNYYLFGNHLDEALEQADAILAHDPENPDGHALRGAVYLRRDEPTKARQEIDLALDADPGHEGAIAALVGLERKRGKSGSALQILESAIERDPTRTGFLLLRAQLLIERGALTEAEDVFWRLIELDPDNLDHKTNLAKLLIKQERVDDAEVLLRDMIATAALVDEKPRLLLVDFLVSQRGFSQAETALLGFLEESPKNHAYRFALAEVYLKAKNRARAAETYREVIELDANGPQGLGARAALAQIHLARREKQPAQSLISDILEVDPQNGDALFLRAQILLDQGEENKAIADLRTLLRQRPGFTAGRALLAGAHLRNGDPALAIEAYRTLLEFEPQHLEAKVQLAHLLARQGENDAALALLDEALGQASNHLMALRTKAEIFRQEADWGGLRGAATDIIERTPERTLGHLMRAEAYLAEQRYDEASADFRRALELQPGSLRPVAGLVQSYLAMEKGDEAEKLLMTRLAETPEDGALQNLLGEFYRARQQSDLSELAFRNATKICSDCRAPYLNLGRLLARNGRTEEAIKIYREGLNAAPDSEDLKSALAATHFVEKDYGEAIRIYEKMLARNPKLDAAANNLAALIADFEHQDQARLGRALELAKRFEGSKNPQYLDTIGWVYYRLGEIDQALSFLEQATAKAPRSPQLQYHLGMAYLAAGNQQKARAALNKAVTGEADYPGIQVARATLKEM